MMTNSIPTTTTAILLVPWDANYALCRDIALVKGMSNQDIEMELSNVGL